MWSLFSRNALGSLPFEILDIVAEDERTIWKLHKGKRKQNGEEVSIFVCESSSGTVLDLAKGAVKRLKTLKHPCILTYFDSVETEKEVYLVTEAVTPLMKSFSGRNDTYDVHSSIAAWGLLQVLKGLDFLNSDVSLSHNNICESSIFVTHGGEWKMFGLEYASADSQRIPIKVIPELSVYEPPEYKNKSRSGNLWSADMWGLGCLIWEVFNVQLRQNKYLEDTSKIPQKLLPTYCVLVAAIPSRRPNASSVIEKLLKPGQFFANDLIDVLSILEEIHIKEDTVKHRFFSKLVNQLDNIPDFITRNKILPALLSAHEFSNAGSVILPSLFKIGQILDDSEYQSKIVPCVVTLFSSSDRATRLKLLQQMESLAEHLDKKTVNDKIFTPLVSGFQDTNPTIREQSVKAILPIAHKLNYNNLNVELMKHFAKLQSRDDQGGIRTNTTVCLGKLASFMHADARKKCLVSAFTRAMRDPFPPARIAGVTALAATQQYYPLSDVSSRILPALSHLTLDTDKSVRDAVFRVLKGFVGKLEKVSEDPSLQEVMESEVDSASSPAAQASMWAGWAVGALTSKFYKTSVTKKPEQPVESLASHTTSARPASAPVDESLENVNNTSALKSLDKNTPDDDMNMPGKELQKLHDSLDDFGTAGDGWEAEEEWGSLEVGDTTAHNVENKTDSSIKSTALYNWGDTSPDCDFFASFEAKVQPKLKSVPQKKPTSTTNSGNAWDDWEKGNELQDSSAAKQSTDIRMDELKKQREEKRLQRQKEIEGKRAARAGPMKLGAKKF